MSCSKVREVASQAPMITLKTDPPTHPVPPTTYIGGAKNQRAKRNNYIRSEEKLAFTILVCIINSILSTPWIIRILLTKSNFFLVAYSNHLIKLCVNIEDKKH